jgi:hypothetical protein
MGRFPAREEQLEVSAGFEKPCDFGTRCDDLLEAIEDEQQVGVVPGRCPPYHFRLPERSISSAEFDVPEVPPLELTV